MNEIYMYTTFSFHSHSLEDLRKEFMDLNTQLRKFLQQLGSADPKVKDTFEFFVEVSP